MPVRRRGEADREDRRRTLIQAADELLRELPYLDVRVEDVARAAGVAKGTVFLYFRNKEALALAVLRARVELVAAQLIADSTRVSSPEGLVVLMLEAHQNAPETARMIALFSAVLQHAAPNDEVKAFRELVRDRVDALAVAAAPALRASVDEVHRLIDQTGMLILSHAVTGREERLGAQSLSRSWALSA